MRQSDISGAVNFEVAYNHVYAHDNEGIDIKETTAAASTFRDGASTTRAGTSKSPTMPRRAASGQGPIRRTRHRSSGGGRIFRRA